jgi:transcriptional regulator GlxA family with amidase domain
MDRRVQNALDLMHQDYKRRLTVNEIAASTNLSTSHFCHLFQREIGIGPARYLALLRMRKIEELLNTTTLSVKDILAGFGFADSSHFLRTFHKQHGLGPTAYRHEAQESSFFSKKA